MLIYRQNKKEYRIFRETNYLISQIIILSHQKNYFKFSFSASLINFLELLKLKYKSKCFTTVELLNVHFLIKLYT